MTAKEKKLLAIGACAGILAAAVSVGLFMYSNARTYAVEKTPPTPISTTQPTAVATQPDDQGTQSGATLELTPAEITAAGVQVADVRTAILKTDIASFGRVEQPEAQLAAMSARIGGRVDKLYVQYTGESVRRGQPIADVYSPEVATAIADYRLSQETRNQLRQSDDPNAHTQADALVAASQRKLELWGISGKQIEAPETNGVPHITLYASASGSVVERKVTQGQYVNAGDTLFTVADLSQVWIKADVYEDQLPNIRRGQEVEITAEALPNRTLHGHVDFIEPAANPQTRTVPVHVHVANPGMRLLPGMFVNASFISHASGSSIVVPRSAVLDTGTRKIVYVAKPNGVFEAREVTLGAPSDDLFPVTSGLVRGDKVVLSGNFLLDSQAHLSSGMSGLYGGSKEFAASAANPASGASAAPAPANAKIDLRSDNTPLKAGEDNLFRATLTGADGKPVTDAQVKLTLVMPAMPAMGMPEMKSSADLIWNASQNSYTGKAQAGMSGSWTVTVEARKNGAVIATLHTHLSAK
jgi:membrane fusion protein, copper/silver efflux system